MSAGPSSVQCLTSREGELVSVQVSVEPRMLEDLLDALAGVSFPVNPEIHHASGSQCITIVAFPAYRGRLDEVHRCLAARGLTGLRVDVESMLDHIHGH